MDVEVVEGSVTMSWPCPDCGRTVWVDVYPGCNLSPLDSYCERCKPMVEEAERELREYCEKDERGTELTPAQIADLIWNKETRGHA